MTLSFIHTYRGIGDTIYSMPSIENLCRNYDEVYGATAFPLLYKSIPNFRPLNPFDYDYAEEWARNELGPSYFEHCHDTAGEFVASCEWKKEFGCWVHVDIGKATTFRVSLALEQFQPGRNMIRNCLGDWCPAAPVLRLPDYPGRFDRVAELFLGHIRGSRPPLLFHAVDQNIPECVADRACPNMVFARLAKKFKSFRLYDARKMDSDRPILFPQRQVPIYNSTGWKGICGIMALMKKSAGAVIQNSCSLLPLAQAMGKPVLVLNGPCGLRLEHCTDAALPPEQRRHVFVEADQRCECKTTGEECCKPVATYSTLDEKVAQFMEML